MQLPHDWKRIGVLASVCLLLSGLLHVSSLATDFNAQIASRVDFQIREWLGRGVQLSNRLKIFAYEDVSVGATESGELTAHEWEWLIKGISATKPRTILLDKMFLFPNRAGGKAAADALSRKETQDSPSGRIANGVAPVIAAAFTSEQSIRERKSLNQQWLEANGLRLTSLLMSPNDDVGLLPSWLMERSRVPYGPHASHIDTISRIGHVDHAGMGLVPAIRRVNEQYFLPHWALASAETIRFDGSGGLFVDGKSVPMNSNGHILANLLAPSRINLNLHNFMWLGSKVRAGELGKHIEPGDTVVLLASLFTGATEFKETALGRMPGGYVMLSVLNSYLQDQWIQPMGGGLVVTLMGGMLAILAGALLAPVSFALAIGLGGGLVFAASQVGFSFFGLVTPWFSAEVAMFLCGSVIFVDRMRSRERGRRKLRAALQGMVDDERLASVLDQGKDFRFLASEQIITIMFIDIAEFSKYAEHRSPRDVFDQLRGLLGYISETVHSFGGIVDRALGDGLLCYFGYQFVGDEKSVVNHADAALECAIKIQRDHMARCMFAIEGDYLINPLRIGLNSSLVFVGDVGTRDRLDFTVIGHGVNFAQRLESACEPSRVMLTSATTDLLTKFSVKAREFSIRLLRAKGEGEALEAYEYDPFIDNEKNLQTALNNFREKRGIQRKDDRWAVPAQASLRFKGAMGDAELVNFSNYGLALRMDCYLTKGFRFNLTLADVSPTLSTKDQMRLGNTVSVEVRWGRKAESGFVHGVQIHNLESEHLAEYIQALRNALHASVLTRSLDEASAKVS